MTVAALGEATGEWRERVVIELTPRRPGAGKLYVSTRSFLILREEIPIYYGNELQPTSLTATIRTIES